MMKSLELKIIPPVVFSATGLLMWWLAKLEGIFPPLVLIKLLSPVLGLIGLVFILSAALQFKGARTTIHPTNPDESSALVMEGVFSISRNPMYLGLLIFLVAWACWLASVFSLLGCIFFVLYITHYQILPEERALEKIFGNEFRMYKQRVRRWL